MTPPTLDAIARETGTFLIVAMDQRESLRTMLAEHRPPLVADEQLVDFKLAVARELGPLASGFLIDRLYGFEEIVAGRLLPRSCGLILAADELRQEPAGSSRTRRSIPLSTRVLPRRPAWWRSSCS